MTEPDRGDQAALFPKTVGERLRAAREARGIALAEVASRTRVPLRHLQAIEDSDFSLLPSVTYAVGFVRGYARAVGEDEVALAAATRVEVANTTRATPQYEPYEIADPARVPSRLVAIIAAGLGLAVLVLGLLWFTTGIFSGEATQDTASPAIAAVPATVPTAAPTPLASGLVRLTANGEIWMRVYDAADKTLYLGTMKAGETWDVPTGADNPMINIGRPDKLAITLNGAPVAPLGTGDRAIKDVPISAAALSARAAGQPAPIASATPLTGDAAGSSATSAVPAAFRAPSPRPRPRRTEVPGDTNGSSEPVATPRQSGAQAPPGVAAPAPAAPATTPTTTPPPGP